MTDANVALGYINPEMIAARTLPIDRDRGLAVINEQIAEPLGLNIFDAALGILDVANATMVRALRAVSTERGRDIRELTLMAFGGSGPVHAATLAYRVNLRSIVIPPVPGVFSALGLLLADDRFDYLGSFESPLTSIKAQEIDEMSERLIEAACRDVLGDSAILSGGSGLQIETSLDLRYALTSRTLNVPIDQNATFDPEAIRKQFTEMHFRNFGFEGAGELILESLRIRATAYLGQPLRPEALSNRSSDAEARPRKAYFRESGMADTRILLRQDLNGTELGPIIVEDDTTTLVVPPMWAVREAPYGCLALQRVESI